MQVNGIPVKHYRSNIWGEYGIAPGGANEATGNDGHAVIVNRKLVKRPGFTDRFTPGTDTKLYLCGSLELAEVRMNFEARRYQVTRYMDRRS